VSRSRGEHAGAREILLPAFLAAVLPIAALLVLVDALLPLEGVVEVSFALLVGATIRVRGRRSTWIAASVATVGILLGALLSPGAGVPRAELANRGLAIVVVWGFAQLCLRNKRIQAGLGENAARLERELEARELAERRFRLVVDATPNGLVMVNSEGSIVLTNRMAEQLFGYGPGEMVGLSVDALVPSRKRERHPDQRAKYLRSPDARAMGGGRDLRAVRKDGSEFPVEIGLNPIRTEEGTLVLSAIVDISERVRARRDLELYAAELRRSNKELDRFAYVASHDLKAPLRAIGTLARWTEEDAGAQLSAESHDHLKMLRGRVSRMEKLLDDLLQYSRAGRRSAEPEEIDVTTLVHGVLDLIAPAGDFRIEVAPDLPSLRAPRAPIQQLFLNLLANSVKHHDRPDGRIRVTGRRVGDVCEYTVEDDGPGIPPEHRERVFGMFQTLRPRDEVEGSGMGLAIIKKLVEAYGGNVWIEGDEDRGARFVLSIPAECRLTALAGIQEEV